MRIRIFLLLFFSGTCLQWIKAQPATDARQQYQSLGDFKLENGQTIIDCRIGYRAYGKLNENRSNVIIFPTWFTGTTKNLEAVVPGKLIDTTAFYLILIDALGDGYSTSPNNSSKQPRLQFPVFTIRDMVESEYEMLTRKMNIQHVKAVAGISMGGMQAFQWAVSHPGFMDKVIPIVGTPQLSSNDLLLWNTELQAMEHDTAYHDGNYKGMPSLNGVVLVHQLALTTPEYLSENIGRDSFDTWLESVENNRDFDWNNWHRQLEAMISHDVASKMNGSLEAAADRVRAKMLVIVSKQDHMVNPIQAMKFAQLLKARLLTLDSNCGHIATGCESDKINAAVKRFLTE